MGTLAERYRAAAAGVAAVYLPTGAGSIVRKIGSQQYCCQPYPQGNAGFQWQNIYSGICPET